MAATATEGVRSETADPVILNLGCGTRTSPHCTNIDWTPYVRVAQRDLTRKAARKLLRGSRAAKLDAISGKVVAHDLRKGIPYDSNSVDGVYLSHVLEHLDRDVAPVFVEEIHRVLKPGGVARIVVPDLALLCHEYLRQYEAARIGDASPDLVEQAIVPILEQSVRRRSRAVPGSGPKVAQAVMSLALGDARKRGETHQWMYDAVTLRALLDRTGFTETSETTFESSRMAGWDAIGLDEESGAAYKPGSLYIEGIK